MAGGTGCAAAGRGGAGRVAAGAGWAMLADENARDTATDAATVTRNLQIGINLTGYGNRGLEL
jgi:hypothetical protein